MSATGDGIGHYMDTAGTIAAPVATYSYSFWYKATHTPNNSGGTTNPMGIDAAGGSTYDTGMTYDHPNAAVFKSFVHLQAAGGACRVQLVSTPAANVWNHYCITWDGGTLSVYLNGVLDNTAIGTNPPSVAPRVTVLAYANGASGFDAGTMAELCIWSVTLTAAEAFSLGTGTLATTIENASITFYSTLNTGDAGQLGPVLTNHSCVLNHSFFQSCDGGVEFGGNQLVVATAFHWTPTGGPAFGGSATIVMAAYHWTPTGGPAFGGDQTSSGANYNVAMTGGVAFGGNQMGVKTTYLFVTSGGVAYGGTMPVVQASANGAVVIETGREISFTTK